MYLTGHHEDLGTTPQVLRPALGAQKPEPMNLMTSFENQFNLSIDPNQVRPSEVLSPSMLQDLDP
jgi:hypothetical protein